MQHLSRVRSYKARFPQWTNAANEMAPKKLCRYVVHASLIFLFVPIYSLFLSVYLSPIAILSKRWIVVINVELSFGPLEYFWTKRACDSSIKRNRFLSVIKRLKLAVFTVWRRSEKRNGVKEKMLQHGLSCYISSSSSNAPNYCSNAIYYWVSSRSTAYPLIFHCLSRSRPSAWSKTNSSPHIKQSPDYHSPRWILPRMVNCSLLYMWSPCWDF